MNDIHWVIPFRHEYLTLFFKAFPIFASENFYLIFISIGYWCWKKVFFRDLAILVCLSTLINCFLKSLFHMPRPAIEQLIQVIDPFGFPSGDIQVVTTIWLSISWYFKNRLLTLFSIILILLVGASRIYLGVHTPLDVLAGFSIGFLIYQFYIYIRQNAISIPLNLRFFLLFFGISCLYFIVIHHDLNKMNIAAPGMLLGILLAIKFEQHHSPISPPPNLLSRFFLALFGLGSVWLLRWGLSFSYKFEPQSLYLFISYSLLGFYLIDTVPWVGTYLKRSDKN